MVLLLSSCASQQDLVDLQRQLQTTRGELAAVRKGVAETRTLVDEQIRSTNEGQKELVSRTNEQMNTILAAIEAQQKAIASLNSFAQEKAAAADQRAEERLRRVEEQIRGQEKGYLASQGNLGGRLEELGGELKIVQGKLEENNNLLAEQGIRLDEVSQQILRSGSRVETAESNLRAIREAQSSYGEKVNRVEGQVASLVKSWEGWREQSDRSLSHATGLEKRLEAVEAELRQLKEACRSSSSVSPVGAKETAERAAGSVLLPPEKEVAATREGVGSASPVGGDEIYRAAYADYTQGSYDLAISGFGDYLAKYPKGSLAANSQYWLGECYYSQKRFKEAIIAFEAVLKNYPKSPKAPGALLKKGYSYLGLGDVAGGKGALMEVWEKYPKTREATLAEDMLRKMQ
jgi:tol-pal system protein YbgF